MIPAQEMAMNLHDTQHADCCKDERYHSSTLEDGRDDNPCDRVLMVLEKDQQDTAY